MGIKYPEHYKLDKIKNKSQAIGEFIEAMLDKDIRLCEWVEERSEYHPIFTPINDLLAEHFSIDLDALEDEKVQMIREIRKANNLE